MLDKIKLQKLKKAVKNMETVNDKFFIDGENSPLGRTSLIGASLAVFTRIALKKKFYLGLMTVAIL